MRVWLTWLAVVLVSWSVKLPSVHALPARAMHAHHQHHEHVRRSSHDAMPSDYPAYTEAYFSQKVDHARYDADQPTFQHRYLYTQQFWTGEGALANGCRGPILFYAGNEGSIDGFWSSNGFMLTVLAPSWHALVLFGEERFYGRSLPFGPVHSFNQTNVQLLTTEQVLSDYVDLLNYVRSPSSPFEGAANCPIIAFGGSYGATLAAYLRIRYPFLITGALASSPELLYYTHDLKSVGLNEFTFIDIAINDYATVPTAEGETNCFDQLVAVAETLRKAASSTDGQKVINSILPFCSPVSSPSSASSLLDFVTEVIETLPQENYPYAVGSLPAWPINATCAQFATLLPSPSANLTRTLHTLYDWLVWFYGTPQPCWSLPTVPATTPGDGVDHSAWGYQSCTETMHAQSARGWRTYTFNESALSELCEQLWGTAAKPDLAVLEKEFGGLAGLLTASRLILTSGGFDPWSAFYPAVLPELPSSVYLLSMPEGAHHLDLRAPNAADPPNVTATRAREQEIMRGWIDQFDKDHAGLNV